MTRFYVDVSGSCCLQGPLGCPGFKTVACDQVNVQRLCCHCGQGNLGDLSIRTMVLSRPGLWLRAMSRSVALPQPGSVLMSVAPETTEDQANLEVWATTWGHVDGRGPCCPRGHAGPSGLHCPLEPCWHPHLGFCIGPCLDLWSYYS